LISFNGRRVSVNITARRAVRLAAGVGLAVTAVSAAEARTGGVARRGIVRAEVAGIEVDRAAKMIMAAAPIGSCLNDPTQSKCDTPTEIVADGHVLDSGATGYANLPSPPAALTRPVDRRARARAAYVTDQCWVRATSLVKSTGWARAYGQNYCTTRVTEHELFVTLREFWKSDSKWHQMDVGHAGPAPGGVTINAHAEYPCRSTSYRAWHNLASGYAAVGPVWYAGQNEQYENLPCVG
jgi:hypothetical protein